MSQSRFQVWPSQEWARRLQWTKKSRIGQACLPLRTLQTARIQDEEEPATPFESIGLFTLQLED